MNAYEVQSWPAECHNLGPQRDQGTPIQLGHGKCLDGCPNGLSQKSQGISGF